MCLAQGHNAVTPVRLEPTTPLSQVKHSTTEPLCSPLTCKIPMFKFISLIQCRWTAENKHISIFWYNFSRLRAAGSCLTGITVLWSLSKTHYPSFVLVQPRKTRPCLTEKLLMGRKESYQTKKKQKNNNFFTRNVDCRNMLKKSGTIENLTKRKVYILKITVSIVV